MQGETDSRQRILVADDEASIRRILETRLKMVGYDVVVAEDGEEAVNVFNKTNPDLVEDSKIPSILAKTRVKPDYDIMGISSLFMGPMLDMMAAYGNSRTSQDFNIEDMTLADSVFTPRQGDRGFNTFNKKGYDPGSFGTPVQFTGTAKCGGAVRRYEKGGEYVMSEEEIQALIASGAKIEYL